jgi:hypothetical protein
MKVYDVMRAQEYWESLGFKWNKKPNNRVLVLLKRLADWNTVSNNYDVSLAPWTFTAKSKDFLLWNRISNQPEKKRFCHLESDRTLSQNINKTLPHDLYVVHFYSKEDKKDESGKYGTTVRDPRLRFHGSNPNYNHSTVKIYQFKSKREARLAEKALKNFLTERGLSEQRPDIIKGGRTEFFKWPRTKNEEKVLIDQFTKVISVFQTQSLFED